MQFTVEVEENDGLHLAVSLFEITEDDAVDGVPPLVRASASGAALLLYHRDGRRAKVNLAALAEQWAGS